MPVTTTLVHQAANHLRYLVVGTGAGAVPDITSTGAASPDLITDTLAGPLKNIAKAFTNGYGKLPAGALTQAQARALWLSDDAGNAVVGGVPHARVTVLGRSAVGLMSADANVDGQGHVLLQFQSDALGAFSFYIDIEVHAIGD